MAEYRPIAPVDYLTGKLNKKDKTVFRQKKRKIYIKFDCYVRSKIWRELCQTEKGGS